MSSLCASPPSADASSSLRLEDLHAQVWRASSLGASASPCVASGFPTLDAELPGGGWPTRGLSEILLARQAVLEWRLLTPALRPLLAGPVLPGPASARRHRAAPSSASASVRASRPLLLVNPPLTPHLAGLQACGLPPQHLVWISAATPQQQLWATEQAIKSNAAAAILAWLPQARPEQIRRLQSHALATEAPIFIFRPLQVQGQSSAAPLRLAVSPSGWDLQVQILKRRGPVFEGHLSLAALPTDLERILTPRMRVSRIPSVIRPVEPGHALARPAQPVAAH